MENLANNIANAYVRNVPSNPGSYIEVEFRFGSYPAQKGTSNFEGYQYGITRRDYDVLMSSLKYPYTTEIYRTESYRRDTEPNVTYRITTKAIDPNNPTAQVIPSYSAKTLLSPFPNGTPGRQFLPQYGGWLAISKETVIAPFSIPEGKVSTRDINRRSYTADSVRIDLSSVIMNGVTVYELEIEGIYDARGGFPRIGAQMAKQIAYMYITMWESALPYTEIRRREVIDFLINNLGTSDITKIPRPREFVWKDMTYGGILNKNNTYHVAVKLDGQSAFLIVKGTPTSKVFKEVWLYTYNQLSLLDDKFDKYKEDMIIFGELYNSSFFGIDRIHPELGDDYTNIIHGGNISRLLDELNGRQYAFNFYTRSSREIVSVGNFYTDIMPTMLKLMNDFKVVTYPGMREYEDVYKTPIATDGLVFIPNVRGWRNRLSGSAKWKNTDKLSVDLSITWRRNVQNMDWIDVTYGTDTRFPGIVSIESISNFLGYNATPTTLPTGSIMEFVSAGIDDEGRIQLVPLKLRTDKIVPNVERRVKSILRLMKDNIPVSTLLGNNLMLMRKYHNRLKRILYAKDAPKGKVLVDLGSGNGGDISKWKLYDTVYAIEPNAKNMNELRKRLANSLAGGPKVIPLELSAFDTSGISSNIQGRVDTLSVMLSASFFWMDNYYNFLETVRMLISRGLKRILIFTIDGYAVKFAMDSPLSPHIHEATLFTENPTSVELATLRQTPDLTGEQLVKLRYYKDTKRLFVKLEEDTILGNEGQMEGLVFIDDLVRDLGLRISYTDRANKEVFLNLAEKRLTSLYSSYVLEVPSYELATIPTSNPAEALLLALQFDQYRKLYTRNLVMDSSKYQSLAVSIGTMIVIDDEIYNKAGKFIIVIKDGKLVVNVKGSEYYLTFLR